MCFVSLTHFCSRKPVHFSLWTISTPSTRRPRWQSGLVTLWPGVASRKLGTYNPMRGYSDRCSKSSSSNTPKGNGEEDSKALQLCHSRGWLQSDLIRLSGSLRAALYTFPSPLHLTSISWLLSPSCEALPFGSVKELAMEVIRHFRPRT